MNSDRRTATLFGWLSYALKTLHNFAGPLFAVSLVIVFFTFVRDELPRKGDGTWLRKGGGAIVNVSSAAARLASATRQQLCPGFRMRQSWAAARPER